MKMFAFAVTVLASSIALADGGSTSSDWVTEVFPAESRAPISSGGVVSMDNGQGGGLEVTRTGANAQPSRIQTADDAAAFWATQGGDSSN